MNLQKLDQKMYNRFLLLIAYPTKFDLTSGIFVVNSFRNLENNPSHTIVNGA